MMGVTCEPATNSAKEEQPQIMTTEMGSEQDEANEVAQKVMPIASKPMKSSSSQNDLQRLKGH